MGAFALGNASPNLQNFATARGAAHGIYGIIDMASTVHDWFSTCKLGRGTNLAQ